MILAILGAVRTPLGAPPGRRRLMTRFSAEICALTVYVLALLVAWLFRREPHPWMIGAIAGYGLAWVLMILGPIGSSAMVLVSERDRGTIDALLVTPNSHAAVALGRYWHVAGPWVRFMLWMVPIYVTHAFNGGPGEGFMGGGGREETMAISLAMAVAPRQYLLLVMGAGAGEQGLPLWCAGFLMAARFVFDLIGVLVVAAIAFYVSARARRVVTAVILGYLVVIGSILTVFMGVEWIAALLAIAMSIYMETRGGGVRPDPGTLMALYAIGKALMFSFQAFLAFGLVRAVARNFDRYMLGAEARA